MPASCQSGGPPHSETTVTIGGQAHGQGASNPLTYRSQSRSSVLPVTMSRSPGPPLLTLSGPPTPGQSPDHRTQLSSRTISTLPATLGTCHPRPVLCLLVHPCEVVTSTLTRNQSTALPETLCTAVSGDPGGCHPDHLRELFPS